jgi:hypothetical protein
MTGRYPNGAAPNGFPAVSKTSAPPVDPPDPPAGGDGFNHIRYTLVTKGDVPHMYLATVDWSLFAQLSPKNFGAPVAQGTHAMTAGSPFLEIAVPAATVPAGWYFLVLSDADGTTTLACPVQVV